MHVIQSGDVKRNIHCQVKVYSRDTVKMIIIGGVLFECELVGNFPL